MIFHRAPAGRVRLSASVARDDQWLPDGLHLRFDTHPDLGFPQTPWLLSWRNPPNRATRFDTDLEPAPDNPRIWRMQRRMPAGSMPANRSSDRWIVRPDAPLEFMLQADDISIAEIDTRGSSITAQGLVDGPDGLEVALEVSGTSPVLSGHRMRAVRLLARRPTDVFAVRGYAHESAWEPKLWGNPDTLAHALSPDLWLRHKRLDAAQARQAQSHHVFQSLARMGLTLAQGTQAKAILPMFNGEVPTGTTAQQQILALAQHVTAMQDDFRTLLDAGSAQAEQVKSLDIAQADNVPERAAQPSELARHYMAAETAAGAVMFGRRLALPLATPGLLPVSARAIFAVNAETFGRLNLPNEARLMSLDGLQDSLHAHFGALMGALVPKDIDGPFVALEVRGLFDTRVIGNVPLRPLLSVRPEADPFVPRKPARRVVLQADIRSSAQLVFDRSVGFAKTRLNPDLGNGLHAPIFGTQADDIARNVGDRIPVLLRDDEAPLRSVSYQVAQSDGFGRWSVFATQPVAMPPRPLPPAPTLIARWKVNPDGSGHIQCRVTPPHEGMMPPGATDITGLSLSLSIPGARQQSNMQPLSGPLPAEQSGDALTHVFSVDAPSSPGLPPREAVVTAHWLDQPIPVKVKAEVTLTLPDPSPPPPPPAQPTLTPLGQPDMSGICRAELTVSGIALGTSHLIVEAAQESSVVAALLRENPDLETEVTDIHGLADLAERADRYKAKEQQLPDSAWAFSGEAEVKAGEALVSHRVNGLPRDLVALRLRSRTDAGVASATGPVAWFGLASSPPLAAPMLHVSGVVGDEPAFRIEVARPAGTLPDEIRIRRSAVTEDPANMIELPVISVAEDAEWPLVVVDNGQTALGRKARLPAWRPLAWSAEARAAPRFVGAPSGPWTKVGPVARATWLPEGAPETPRLELQRATLDRIDLRIENLRQGDTAVDIVAAPASALTGVPDVMVTDMTADVVLFADTEKLRGLVVRQIDAAGRQSPAARISGLDIRKRLS